MKAMTMLLAGAKAMVKAFPAITAFFCFGFLFFCGQTAAGPSLRPITVTDFRGAVLALDKPAERVVCLIESALSGLYMLGAQDRVVGISANVYQGDVFSYYAAMDSRIARRQLPAPGNWDFVNIETIVALAPDLVIIWSHQTEAIAALEERGIPVYGVMIRQFANIDKEIDDLGALTGHSARARQLIRFARQELSRIRQWTAQSQLAAQPGVYFMWAQGELETSGRPSTVDELISLAGGRNICGHIGQEHLVIQLENLLQWDPDVVVMWTNAEASPASIAAKPVWQSISAVRNKRVYELPEVFTCDLWTLKYLLAVRLTATWCHPERLADVDRVKTARALFTGLYGPELTERMPLEKAFR